MTPPATPQQDDAGYTLIELLIVCGLMSLLAVLVATTMIDGLRTAARAEKKVDDVSHAQVAVRLVSRDVRAARGFTVVTPTSLQLLTSSSGTATATPGDAPQRVSYDLQADGSLVRTVEQGTGTDLATWTPSGSPVTTTLVTHVLSPSDASGRAVFTALSAADSKKQCPTGPTLSSLGGTVTGTNLNKVYAVDVWLSVNSGVAGSPAVTVPGGSVVSAASAVGDIPLDTGTLASAGIGQGC